MSFQDTFTRSSSNSENLRYDGAAAYHFYMTILLIVGLPLGWSILRTIFNPFSHIPTLSQLQTKKHFRQKVIKFKKQNKYSYITFKFILKIIVFGCIVFGIVKCTQTIMNSENEIKGFDPYQILQIESDAPIQKIKKAYRKLALLYHPDRNPDNPEASARFIIISKAYECLTDQQAKQKCLKYGNPDGSSSFNVGIALPQFLVKKENHIPIMGIVFLLVVIVLPIYLIHYHSEMNKYDDFGMRAQNFTSFAENLNQQFGMKDAAKIIGYCRQFADFNTTSKEVVKLEALLKQLSEQQRSALPTKNFRGFVRKTYLLAYARLNEKEVAEELLQDYKIIMRKTPVIIKSSVHFACERSGEMYKGHPSFIGKLCVFSLILFQQYFIQGRCYETSESFMQLDLSEEQIDRIFKKKKRNKKMVELSGLITSEDERNSFLGLLDSNRSVYIKECLEYFPTVDAQCNFKMEEDDSEIGAQDFFQIIATVTSNRLGNFCSAASYPFLKKEGWHIILSNSTSNTILFHEYFHFDQLTKTFKLTYRQEKKGTYALNLRLMSDCYFGLDLNIDFKYKILEKKENKVKQVEDQQVQQESYIRKIFNSLSTPDVEEVSDEEDGEDKKEVKDEEESKEIMTKEEEKLEDNKQE